MPVSQKQPCTATGCMLGLLAHKPAFKEAAAQLLTRLAAAAVAAVVAAAAAARAAARTTCVMHATVDTLCRKCTVHTDQLEMCGKKRAGSQLRRRFADLGVLSQEHVPVAGRDIGIDCRTARCEHVLMSPHTNTHHTIAVHKSDDSHHDTLP